MLSKNPPVSSNVKSLIFDAIVFAYLIGVLLIFVLRPSEDQLLNLSNNFILVLLSLLSGGLLAAGLNRIGVTTLGLSVFQAPHEKLKGEVRPWYRTFWGLQLSVVFTVLFIVAARTTGFSIFELLDKDGFEGAKRIFGALLSPDLSILPQGVLAIIETIYIAFLATVFAVPVAFMLAFFCAKNIMTGPVAFPIYVTIRVLLNATRAIEPIIWAIIFSVWVGIGPFAGMLALMIQSVASLTKQYSEIIESVDEGPIEGVLATGANKVQVVWYAIVPQVILPYISFTIYRWDINVRMATIIGLVGGGGIGTLLIQYQGQALWNEVGTLALLIVAIVWALDTASAYLREAIK